MYICADDYGISEGACRHIEECIKKGALNKISILPNSDFADCSKYLEKYNVLLALHLNLVEGKSLSDASDVSLLVSENRHFKHSFEGLLLLLALAHLMVFMNVCAYIHRILLSEGLHSSVKLFLLLSSMPSLRRKPYPSGSSSSTPVTSGVSTA